LIPFHTFRFSYLLPPAQREALKKDQQGVIELLKVINLSKDDYAFGKTKVFFESNISQKKF